MNFSGRYVLFAVAGWVALIGASLYFNVSGDREDSVEQAKIQARTAIQKDILYRRWIADLGGVYAEISSFTPPNPYLAGISERDIETPSHKKLTLINPAYMTRQVHKLSKDAYGLRGNITSLHPLNPDNKPQEWEVAALHDFEKGVTEAGSMGYVDGVFSVRLMLPLRTEESCLPCHAQQGYKVGEVRGGISVSLPMTPFLAMEQDHFQALIFWHFIIALVGSLLLFLGITKVGEYFFALQESNAMALAESMRAKEASRAKGDFLANISHEVRTPISGVIGMTNLLLETNLTPEQKSYAEIVQNSSRVLLNIINDILDFSKMKAGKFSISEAEFDLHKTIQGSVNILAPLANEKGLELACFVDPAIAAMVIGDSGRIGQILLNLVSNAVKFTEKGEVAIHVMLEKTEFQKIVVHFRVTDTGSGIPADKTHLLFQSFSQLASAGRRQVGTGLGLAIAKKLTELMGGTIGVESNSPQGSTFWFRIPLALPPTAPKQSAERPFNLNQTRILVVDDNQTARGNLAEMIRFFGGICREADSLEIAQDLLSKNDLASRPIRLCFVDANLPDDGGEKLSRMMEKDSGLAEIPMVFLSFLHPARHLMSSGKAGGREWMMKPVWRDLLLALLERLFPSASSPVLSGNTAMDAPPDFSPINGSPRILVADDSQINREVVLAILRRLGVQADLVATGTEVLEALDRQSYPLVLLDIQMPVLDGFEITRLIREREKVTGKRLPIIAMTGYDAAEDYQKTTEAGMDGHIIKPVRKDALMQILLKYLMS